MDFLIDYRNLESVGACGSPVYIISNNEAYCIGIVNCKPPDGWVDIQGVVAYLKHQDAGVVSD